MYKPDLLCLCDCLRVFAVMGWLCTSTGPLSHLFLFPAICCFLPDFFLFLYLGCTTTNIICVLLSSYNLSVSQKSYNLNEWGNFFCSNHSIFFPENSCICNTMHACSVFLDGHITYCHFLFMKNTKDLNTKKRYWRNNNNFVLPIACWRAMKLLPAVVKVQKDKGQFCYMNNF